MDREGRREFQGLANVSRETFARLDIYEGLLRRWNERINLVAKSTLDAIWIRHFLDSGQLLAHAPAESRSWVDLGSGGGFPGLVVAAMSPEIHSDLQVTLVESDARKATFLRTAAREMGLDVTVLNERAEELEPRNADVLSARALAPLDVLLSFAERHLAPGGVALFPKGARAKREIESVRKSWQFELDFRPSLTDEKAAILEITELSRVRSNPSERAEDHRHRQSERRCRQDDNGDQSRRCPGGTRP